MGFRLPAILPDYQKLKVILANSGVQKWNPPTYEILSRLIDAVSQSQDVIVKGLTGATTTGATSDCCSSPGPGPSNDPGVGRSTTVSTFFNIGLVSVGGYTIPIVAGVSGYLAVPLSFSLIATSNGQAAGFQNGATSAEIKYSNGGTCHGISGLTLGMSGGPPPRLAQANTAGTFNSLDLANAGQGLNIVLPPGVSSALIPPNDAQGNVTCTVTYTWVKI